jgi:hypothetical protein
MHDRWGNYPTLGRIVFLTVREALHGHPHPDSKRQERRKARDLTRYGARILKQARVTSCPVTRISKRREVKLMRQRIREENERQAREVAARLLGSKHAA